MGVCHHHGLVVMSHFTELVNELVVGVDQSTIIVRFSTSLQQCVTERITF